MSGTLPTDRATFDKAWPKFSAWLAANGSSIMAPTNPYEVARFLTADGVGVVYANSADRITRWVGGADQAFAAWKAGQAWRAVEKAVRGSGWRKRRVIFTSLVQRDGSACVYCGCGLALDTATIEHIVPITAGGPDTLINKALACEPCNTAGGHLSPVEKMRKVKR